MSCRFATGTGRLGKEAATVGCDKQASTPEPNFTLSTALSFLKAIETRDTNFIKMDLFCE
jgi:hypothetical protein